MTSIVYESLDRTTRVTYQNFWYRAETRRLCRWVAVRSARTLEALI